MPYKTSELTKNINSFEEYYDTIEIINDGKTHFKSVFAKRNKEMIDRSDLCIFYVTKKNGGAYEAMKYAMFKNKNIINISSQN